MTLLYQTSYGKQPCTHSRPPRSLLPSLSVGFGLTACVRACVRACVSICLFINVRDSIFIFRVFSVVRCTGNICLVVSFSFSFPFPFSFSFSLIPSFCAFVCHFVIHAPPLPRVRPPQQLCRYRTYKKMTCASFVENDVCKTCSGGCGNPANCVTCTTQFMSPHGNSEAFYICDGGLEEIRESCNATVGRKPTPVIATNAGKIQGFIDPDSKHAAFRGIPYAQPPVGDLRWRPPQPPTPWTDVKNVSTFGNTCKQMGPMWATMGGVRNSSEDCLYLNVYAPAAHLQKVTAAAKARAKAKATAMAANTSADVGAEDDAGAQATEHTTREAGLPLLPVMIYFPAGQFMWGSGNDAENFNAPQTAAGEQIIVVTMNYRLGAAGYLALDELKSRDPTGSTGNYGSQDQRAALKWIHDNIAAFGGDPKNTVLWGESAGAAAVTAHLSMEKSWPYFDKAIIESGAFNGWSYKTYSDAVANGVALAKHLNCTYKMNSTASVSDITSVSVPASFSLPAATVTVNVTCMLGVSIDTLVYMDDDTEGADGPEHFLPFADRVDKSLWSPAIDNVELFDTPTNLLKANKVAPVPILFGTNRDEGSTFTYNQTGIGDGNGPNSEGMYDGNLFDWPQMLSQYGGLPSHPQNLSTGLFQYQSDFESWIFGAFGKNATSVAAELVKLYRPANSTTPPSLGPTFNPEGITNWWWSLSRVIGDFVLSCPARQAARLLSTQDNRSVYLFHFNHTPSMSLNQAHTDQFGAFHGSEVPFVYYATIELEGEQELKLSEAIVQYWAGFAYNGDPNIPPPNIVGGLAGLPPFPRFVAGKAEDTLILGDTADGHAGYPNVSTVTALKEVECNFWDKLAAAMADQDWS